MIFDTDKRRNNSYRDFFGVFSGGNCSLIVKKIAMQELDKDCMKVLQNLARCMVDVKYSDYAF